MKKKGKKNQKPEKQRKKPTWATAKYKELNYFDSSLFFVLF